MGTVREFMSEIEQKARESFDKLGLVLLWVDVDGSSVDSFAVVGYKVDSEQADYDTWVDKLTALRDAE